jgi:cation:H+ antiporter
LTPRKVLIACVSTGTDTQIVMEEALAHLFAGLHWSIIAVVIVASLLLLSKAADWLVDEAVQLSARAGIPEVVIGATVISLGTTTPEVAVSVLAAIRGSPGLALGNAVGSIICDTGLILGLACVVAPLKLDRKIVNRQGCIQLGAALALVAASFPWKNPRISFTTGGRLSQPAGLVLLAALIAYLGVSVLWAREERNNSRPIRSEALEKSNAISIALLKLACAVVLVVASAQILIPAVSEAATRLHVPESIIAATMVALGTSLPELVTAVTAARRGHGGIAVGNIVGADILNVLFVAGAAAAVTGQGLAAGGRFFVILYPAMLAVLIVFRAGIYSSGMFMRRPFGFALLGAYGLYLILSYLIPGG